MPTASARTSRARARGPPASTAAARPSGTAEARMSSLAMTSPATTGASPTSGGLARRGTSPSARRRSGPTTPCGADSGRRDVEAELVQ